MKKILLSVVFTSTLLMVGCTDEKGDENAVDKVDAPQKEEANNNNQQSPEAKKEISKEEGEGEIKELLEQIETTTNENIVKQIKEDKEIVDQKVLIMENLDLVVGVLEVAAEVKDDQAKKLAEKYAKKLKEEYPKMETSITVMRNKQEITTVELE